MPKDPLIGVPVEQARMKKWKAGRLAYGGPMQLDPLVELYEEFLDAINYCKAAATDNQLSMVDRGRLLKMAEELKRRAEEVQQMWAAYPKRIYVPTEFPLY